MVKLFLNIFEKSPVCIAYPESAPAAEDKSLPAVQAAIPMVRPAPKCTAPLKATYPYLTGFSWPEIRIAIARPKNRAKTAIRVARMAGRTKALAALFWPLPVSERMKLCMEKKITAQNKKLLVLLKIWGN